MNFDTLYYNQDKLWNKEPLEYQRHVLSDLLSFLPQDITSILDLGCGDGFITNNLPETLRVLGVDWSETALSHCKREKLSCDIRDISLPEKSFDLVMANDVLEHLNEEDLKRILDQMDKLASKYVLITVPFEEWVDNNRTTCLNCSTQFHINLHERAYNLFQLSRLFSDKKSRWTIEKVIFTGEHYTEARILEEFRRKIVGKRRASESALCPTCGFSYNSNCVNNSIELPYSTIDPWTMHILRDVCPRNECIVLFKKTEPDNVPSEPSLSLYNMKTRATVNAQVDWPTLSFQLESEIATKDYDHLALEMKLNNTKFYVPRLLRGSEEKKIFEIPQWLMYQIYSCFKHDIYSRDTLLPHKELYCLQVAQHIKEQAARDQLKMEKNKLEQRIINLENEREMNVNKYNVCQI